MSAYGKFFKELNTYKRKYGPNEKVTVSENVSVVLQRKLPPKLKDPGSFSINITIGDKLVEKAMLDLGASINLMPYSVYLQLGLWGLKATTISLQLADRSVKYPRVLDMEEAPIHDHELPILLGRPFMATTKTIIDVQNGLFTMTVLGETVQFKVFESLSHPSSSLDCCSIDVLDSLVFSKFLLAQSNDPLQYILSQSQDDFDEEVLMEMVAALEALKPYPSTFSPLIEPLGPSATHLMAAVASSSHHHCHVPRPATRPVGLGSPPAQPHVPLQPRPRQHLRPPETAQEQPVFDRTFELSFSVVWPPNRTSEVSADFQVTVSATSGQFLGHHALPACVAARGQQVQLQVRNRGKSYVWLDPSVRVSVLNRIRLGFQSGIWVRSSHLIPFVVKPPKLELKPLPSHLKYAYLAEFETLPVIIASDLTLLEEDKLIRVLKEFKSAIGWSIADIKGINPTMCMHRILLEEGAKPTREPQRRLNPHMKEVVRAEVLKLLDVGIIYPISDSKWVSAVHVVPKRMGITVVKNEHKVLVQMRLAASWRVCTDYRKLNSYTRKDYFPMPFIDQMLERLAGHAYYCFLDGYSGYNQIAIAP
ncbi:unnamed protein product [Prunus armeniaca]